MLLGYVKSTRRRLGGVLAVATVLLLVVVTVPGTSLAAEDFVSDDFSSASLASRWEVVRPLGVGSASVTGTGTADARLALSVPAGTSHDPWRSNNAVRAVQAVSNANLSVEAKFDSMPSQGYQMQGLTVEQSSTTFVRFEVHHNGSGLRLFASTTVDGVPTTRVNTALPSQTQVYLRVVRVNDAWTLMWSGTGTSWTTGTSFSLAMTVAKVGPFVGNYGSGSSAPAFTALVDYAFDTATPVSPEDGGAGSPPDPGDTTPPAVSSVAVNASTSSAQVTFATNEAATGRVEYGTTTSYGTTSSNTTAGTAHSVLVTGLSSSTTYHYRVVATDTAGNTTTTADATFTTAGSNTGPTIDLWNGTNQSFGPPTQSQKWVNVLGNVTDADGVASLTYRLNGGAQRSLSIGPDKRRLQWQGDFNADIAFTDLVSGNNTVELTATDTRGAVTTKTVTLVRRTGASATLPYSLHWVAGSPVAQQAQVVDGKWTVNASGLRTEITGYDRIVTVGDIGWTNYELTVPVTVHALGPAAYSHLSGAPLIGVGMRWNGHTAVDQKQPAWAWYPTGAFAWYRFHESGGKFELRGNYDSPVKYTTPTFAIGTTYQLKVRAETLTSATRYQVKVWPDGTPEPSSWLATIDEPDGPASGAIALIAHQLDGTFGDVSVQPI